MQRVMKSLCVDAFGETKDNIVRIANYNDVSFGVLFTPLFDPMVQHVVKIDVRQER